MKKSTGKAAECIQTHAAFERACRPAHSRKMDQFSDEWFRACDRAFQLAMLEHPGERPSDGKGQP